MIDHRNVFGQAYRMIERRQQHAGADLDALGAHADHAGHQRRRRQVAVLLLVMLGEIEAVETDRLAQFRLLHQLFDHAGTVLAVGRVLGAGEIAYRQHW